MNNSTARNILVYRTGQLGDTVVALPAVRAIGKRHADCRIALLTDIVHGNRSISSWELFEPTGIFSDVLYYDPNILWLRAWRELGQLISRIRKLKPQRLYYLAPSPRTRGQIARDVFFFQVLCGIKDVQGLAATDDWVGRRDSSQHPVRLVPEYLRLLRIAGDVDSAIEFDLPISDANRAKLDFLWRDRGIHSGEQLIAMAPSASWPAQRWPADRYAALARELLSTYPDAYLLILGGQADLSITEAISTNLGERVFNLAGRLTALESAEALRRCSVYVGNNSGLMHVAAACGVPCVAISSARDNPGIWDPYGDGNIILRREVPCAGCRLRYCEEKALICLTGISVEEVMKACASVLGRSIVQHHGAESLIVSNVV